MSGEFSPASLVERTHNGSQKKARFHPGGRSDRPERTVHDGSRSASDGKPQPARSGRPNGTVPRSVRPAGMDG